MAKKKNNPFLEKQEEKLGKDLDKDGEKGESKAHQAKVLGKGNPNTFEMKGEKKKKAPKKKKETIPPAFQNKKMALPNTKKSKPSAGTGNKMCPACIRSNATSCNHL